MQKQKSEVKNKNPNGSNSSTGERPVTPLNKTSLAAGIFLLSPNYLRASSMVSPLPPDNFSSEFNNSLKGDSSDENKNSVFGDNRKIQLIEKPKDICLEAVLHNLSEDIPVLYSQSKFRSDQFVSNRIFRLIRSRRCRRRPIFWRQFCFRRTDV